MLHFQAGEVYEAALTGHSKRMTVTEAAEQFNVTRQTFSEYLNKGITVLPKAGAPQVLSPDMERIIADRMQDVTRCVRGMDKEEFCDLIRQIVHKIYPEASSFKASESWFEGFCKRNPGIEFGKPSVQYVERMRATNSLSEASFFNDYENALATFGPFPPEAIFNADATNVYIKPQARKVRSFFVANLTCYVYDRSSEKNAWSCPKRITAVHGLSVQELAKIRVFFTFPV